MKHSVQELNDIAKEARRVTMKCIASLGKGHVGGALDIVDALTVLYYEEMNIDPANPKMAGRDRLVLSKGHGGPGLYAILALKGFFDMKEIYTLNKPGTMLPSHCDRNKTPGVDMTTGSLGQGTSLAVGMAMGDMLKGFDSRTFLIVGDGEANEGQVWEAAMFTAAKKITSLTWLIDNNKKQLDGYTKDVLNPFDFEEKFRSFGFEAISIDGNDVEQLENALTRRPIDKPIAIILNTVKGKGVEEVENTMGNHSMTPPPEAFDRWLAELHQKLEAAEKGV